MKKIMTIIAAAAVALTLVGCQFGDMDKSTKTAGTKKNLTVSAKNDAPAAKKYQRGWKQLGTKETVQALETLITIDASKTKETIKQNNGKWEVVAAGTTGASEVNSVIGLIFDLHETTVKAADATEAKPAGKYYDFVLIGYQPSGKKYYIERYVDIPDGAFTNATDDGVFATAEEYITDTSVNAFYTPTATTFVTEKTGKLPKSDDEDGGSTDIALQQITVKITQETKGTYKINLGDKEWEYKPVANADWTNKDGYRIGGAGYYVNCPAGLSVKANFNSKNGNTIGLNADEEEF